jgi:hypothetical protein
MAPHAISRLGNEQAPGPGAKTLRSAPAAMTAGWSRRTTTADTAGARHYADAQRGAARRPAPERRGRWSRPEGVGHEAHDDPGRDDHRVMVRGRGLRPTTS